MSTGTGVPNSTHLNPVMQTPRPARPRMSPGPGASPFVGASPRQGSPRGDGRGAAIDVEAVVRANGGDVEKALEAVLAERNSLQQQNTQLWKLIEKQRAQSAQLVQDNERLRSDRERANQRLAAAGLEQVNSKRITNSASAVGLGLKAETPVIRRHNSDRDELRSPQATLEVPLPSASTGSSAQSSPAEPPSNGLLPSPMPDKANRRESRMAFAPEVRSFLSLAESPTAARHNIPPVPIVATTSPASDYSASPGPAAEHAPAPAAAAPTLSAVTELVEEPAEIPVPEPEPESEPVAPVGPVEADMADADKPADPRVVLSRPLEQPRISSDVRPDPPRPTLERTSTDHDSRSRQLPRLSASLLPHTRLTIPHTSVFPNAAGRDVLCFVVCVSVRPPNAQPVSWNVAKLFSAFIDLDTQIRAKSGKRSKDWKSLVAPLPDGRAWKDFAPSKIDHRKAALEAYLQSLLMAPLSDKSDLCHFLSTDPVQARSHTQRKEGYLTKRVKGLGGGWKTRYFVLDGASLDCYEQRGGAKHSSIMITGAQIGRQNRATEFSEDRESRHAFLIIEQTKKGAQRHILCAESDMDRDTWIEALVRQVDPEAPLQRRRSESRKSSRDVVVTASQPLSCLVPDSKFSGAPSPSLFNSLEHQRLASSPSLASHSSHGSVPTVPHVTSPLSEQPPALPEVKASKRQSMLPRTHHSTGPPPAHSAAYLSKLSADGFNAPPGADKDRDRKAKSGRFWPSFGKTPEKVARPVFGVPLADSIAIASIASLPAIVFRAIEYLESKHAEEEEGIYRLSGSSAVIKGLKDRFDVEGDVNLKQIDEQWDPHAIAGLLKSFLRELPTSLLTRESHARFLAVMDLIDSSARVAELARLVGDLPPPNYALLRALTAHLILVVKNAATNKMTLRNIGIVFSPTLGIPAGIFSELVSHFGPIFDAEDMPHGDGEGAETEADAGADVDAETVGRKRNSLLYRQGGADAMLGLAGRALDPVDDSASDEHAEVGEDGVEDLEAESEHFSAPSSENHYTASAPPSALDHAAAATPRAEAYVLAAQGQGQGYGHPYGREREQELAHVQAHRQAQAHGQWREDAATAPSPAPAPMPMPTPQRMAKHPARSDSLPGGSAGAMRA